MDKPYRILVAEDDELTRNAVADNLKSQGFVVITAEDGEKAVNAAVSLHPDLILLDNQMPKLAGIKVIEKVREDDWGKNVPIIFLTSFDTDDAMINVIAEYNPSFYLRKDQTSPDQIVDKIKEALKIS